MKNIKEASNTLMSLYDKLKETRENRVLGISDTLEKILNDNISKFDLLDIDLLFEITLFRITKDSNLITIDNISLYYEFMSHDNKVNNSILLHKLFNRRMGIIYFDLKIDNFNLWLNNILSYEVDNNDFMINCSIFGIVDTLKPIDEYIEEIKQSEAYKEYIAKKA